MYLLICTLALLLKFSHGQTIRSTSGCSVPLCPSNNNSSCGNGSAQSCYAYTIPLTNQTFCAPSVSCSLFEPCADNVVCSSNTSICLSSTCCPQPICMPISLGVTTCNAVVPTLLPSQCYGHTVISDATRHYLYSGSTNACDQTDFATSKWVRFSGSAGTRLATSVTTVNRCGTYYPGSSNDTLPTGPGETKSITVCYYYYGNSCYWSNTVSVTNCLNYYVYLLSSPPTCNLRYCSA